MEHTLRLPNRPAMAEMLQRLLPGKSGAIRRTREQVLDFTSSLTARSLLLRGPIGAGKSTIARVVGLLKRVAPLKSTAAQRFLEDTRFEGHNRIDLRYMPWYVELTLTGLIESLADAQLFGVRKGAFTGATTQRAGVFEQASTGRSEKGKEHDAAKLTGGVVFLDEIGDLAAELQAKLLPVLSGGAFYRVGGEGDPEHELQFHGTVITASWRPLHTGLVRPDLLSRVTGYIVDVPGLGDRMDDFDYLLDGVEDSVIGAIKDAIDHADRVESELDREFWRARKENIVRLDKLARRALAQVDWSRHGNLRGLTAAVEQMIANGRGYEDVIEELPLVLADHVPGARNGLLERLLQVAVPGEGLVGQVKAVEVQLRDQLRTQLIANVDLRRQLALQMSISEQQLSTQLRGLARRRIKGDGEQR